MSSTKAASADRVVSRLPRSRSTLVAPVVLVGVIAIADTFGGILQDTFPATLLLRAVMVGFLIIHILLSASQRQEFRILWVAVIGYFITRVILDCFIFQDFKVLSLEVSATLKLLYFPLLFAYLHSQILKGRMCKGDIHRLLSLYGWLILASLAFGSVTGLGGTIGGRGVNLEGGKGFMIGANEVGLMLILTAPFVGAGMMRLLRSTWLGGFAQLIVYAFAGWHVFTKSSLIAVLTSAFSAYRTVVKLGRQARWSIRILTLSIGIYLVVKILGSLEAIQAFASSTFFSAALNDGVVAFLFRGRQDYISAIYPQLVNHDLSGLFLLFGAGEFYIRELSIGPLMLAQGEGTTFEMDLFDLMGAYGVVGVLLFGVVVTTVLRKAGPYQIPLDVKIAIIGVMVHAFMAGHVLFSPQVTTLLALVLLYFRIDRNRPLRNAHPTP
jgi:hypothetical protein